MRVLRIAVCVSLLLSSTGCEKVQSMVCKEPAASAAKPAKPEGDDKADKDKSKAETPKKADGHAAEPHPADTDNEEATEAASMKDGFPLPFAWESSPQEPLARARAFLRELSRDNSAYMRLHGAPFFEHFAQSQSPRATVLTCADSRVQSAAFDATPENDDFTIRNIGNQFGNAAGSIEYGVEHLNTPVLLVLGHTGCGAVKAAMRDTSKLEAAIRHELEPLVVTKHEGDDEPTNDQWKAAVIENVHAQVDSALHALASRVRSGRLTIIGALYDFRDDAKQGAGKIVLLNVNGNREHERIEAFAKAIELQPPAFEAQHEHAEDEHEGHAEPSIAEEAALTRRLVDIARHQADEELREQAAAAAVTVH